MNRNDDDSAVDSRAAQRRLKSNGDARCIDRGICSTASCQVLDGADHVAFLRVEHRLHADVLQHGASRGRGVAHDHADAATSQREEHADPYRASAVDDHSVTGLHLAAVRGAPGNRHRLYERSLLRRKAPGQFVGHRPPHHCELR